MKINNLRNKIEKAKLLVFDFDGTIVDLQCNWERLKEKLHLFCRDRYGLNIDFSSLNKGIMEIIPKLHKEQQKRVYSVIGQYELKGVNKATPILPTIDFIKKYKHKKKAILSTNTRKAIMAVLKKVRIKSYFNLIIGKEDVRNHKPHPEGLRFIMSFFKIRPQETIFIGDKDIDFKAGKAARVLTCGVKEIATL